MEAGRPLEGATQAGDTVMWIWDSAGHTVTSGDPSTCAPDGRFCSLNDTGCNNPTPQPSGTTYMHSFSTPGTFTYFCTPHCALGMTGSLVVQ